MCRFALALILSLLVVLAAPAAERVALVIGIDEYQENGKLTSLLNARLDARTVAASLRGVGFEIIIPEGENPTRGQMEDAFIRFTEAIQPGGTAAVYFAGHAIEYNGENYLLASNAKLQARSLLGEESMKAQTFAEAMVQSGAKSSFLFLDCCRNLPDDSGWLTRGGGVGQKRSGLADLKVKGDIVIAFAAAPGESALEPDRPGKNGPYAAALAKWIPSTLKHTDFFQEVRKEVHTITGGLQRTWENGSFLDSFYFARGNVVPNQPKVPVMQTAADRLRAATKDAPFVNSLGMEFVPVPGREGVWMCRTETRVRDFRAYAGSEDFSQTGGAFVHKGTHKGASWEMDPVATWDRPGFAQSEDHPVTCVSWQEARAFCEWLSKQEGSLAYRLPSDAEWSAAVGSVGKYPWGNGWPAPRGAGNYAGPEYSRRFPGKGWPSTYDHDDGAERTARVGSFMENRFGFFDLGGNVWEWCEDEYRASLNDAQALAQYPALRTEKYIDGTPFRVVRGASWSYHEEIDLRSSFRFVGHQPSRLDTRGFRVVVAVSGGKN